MRVAAGIVALAVLAGAGPSHADEATDKARVQYDSGVKLFQNQKYEQALIEFQRSYESKPVPPTLFMMAQCEYYNGQLKQAKEHYEAYVEKNPTGDFVDTARDKVEALRRRKSTFAINTIPPVVDVAIVDAPSGREIIAGKAPNNFEVPPGHYRIRFSKLNHKPVDVAYDIDLVETKPIFQKLDPIKAHLEITTDPRNADLFVNDTSTRNPYKQDVEPGRYEIFAKAPEHNPRTVPSFELGPGERKQLTVKLDYVQASGKAELIGWNFALGFLAAGPGAVLAVLDDPTDIKTATSGVVAVGMLTGALALGVPAVLLVPDYIPDNRALFIIGGEWIGAAEGAAVGVSLKTRYRYGFIGGLAGLGAGTVTATLLRDKAPNYGRVAVIQSGALVGALVGALAVPSLRLPDNLGGPGVLAGLNLGLAAGLAMAYLPDQSRYGPTWKRVILIDAMAGVGALVGALASTVQQCASECSLPIDTGAKRTRTARLSLGMGLVGLAAGFVMTRNVDRAEAEAPTKPLIAPMSWLPAPSVLAVEGAHGTTTVPALAAGGRF